MMAHPMAHALNTLRNPNYRIYFGTQLLSMSGTFMQATAVSWLIYRLTNSGAWLGAMVFCTQIPAFLLSPLAGALNDRLERRSILLVVQWVAMIQAFVLAGLVFLEWIAPWQVALLSVLLGVINAFDMTTRHAFAVDMVGKDELGSAIALNSVVINTARIAGPAVAGVVIGLGGEQWCFVANGLSFVATIVGFTYIQSRRPKKVTSPAESMWSSILEGLAYVRRHPLIAWIILVLAWTSVVTPAAMVLLPVIAKDLLGGGAATFAWLSSAMGIGAVIGALTLGTRTDAVYFKREVLWSVAAIGVLFFGIALSRSLPVTFALTLAFGFFNMSCYPRLNTVLQQAVDDRVRGRVLSIYTMTFLGIMPLGALVAGVVSDHIGPARTLAFAGILCVVGTLALGLKTSAPRS